MTDEELEQIRQDIRQIKAVLGLDGTAAEAESRRQSAKQGRLKSCISGFFFYLVLAVFLLLVYSFAGTDEGPPRHILGWSAMTVLTRSMQSEIPQNSLIITYHCDPAQLRTGDNATYLISETATVTHQITAVETGADGTLLFTFKGTDNPEPDKDKVAEGSIVGKVMFHNLALGRALTFIKQHVLFVAVMAVLVLVFLFFLTEFLKKDKTEGRCEDSS